MGKNPMVLLSEAVARQITTNRGSKRCVCCPSGWELVCLPSKGGMTNRAFGNELRRMGLEGPQGQKRRPDDGGSA